MMNDQDTRVAATAGPARRRRPVPDSRARTAGDSAAQVRAELAALVAAATTAPLAKEALPVALNIARRQSHDADVRLMLLKLRQTAREAEGMEDAWSALVEERPDHPGVARGYLLMLFKDGRGEEALAWLDRFLPESLDDAAASLRRAELLADIREHAASDALFERAIARHDCRDLRVEFARRLKKRGLLARAMTVIEPVVASLAPESKAALLAASLAGEYAFYRRYEPEAALASEDIRIVAMKHAILSFRRRVVASLDEHRSKSIALVTGSLGPGGAERQLTRLACHLQMASATMLSSGHAPGVASRVEVLVKQHTEPAGTQKNQRRDFFLGTLRDAGVPVTEINELPVVTASHQPVPDADLLRMLQSLPSPVHYGVVRLAPVLRERRFDVVSLWQDGACLFGALAALLAGVPVIHLVFRGLPPNIRRERDRPEYSVLFKALAEIPGVHFVANSRTGAEAYARWLDLPPKRFHVLYNGVPELDTAGSEQDIERWEAFASDTADASETIGGVFRFESDKRPLSWIKLAARYLRKRPQARFVIVGDGRLLQGAKDLANELGLSGRLLFAGLSSHVGYWYSKMDVKVLLSRFEGLPNVLIEAQMLGVATLSTPAGGAAECFVDGKTGHLLESAEQPDLHAACDKLAALVDRFRTDGATREHARDRARTMFSVNAMAGMFSDLCCTTVGGAQDTHDDSLTA